ncbi:MAG: HEPN domain-containing protein [Melioribacteraceae bacterium]|nr:HEPN domain-containing protein [Melioribacteraceae bacterium]MCF8263883.1 HEPN domain-containing protein [Melioribacteraceae bacterium]MCF8430288.1 HEPN domain-containing protein [Melioribacteraceae bacterium]
MNKQDHINYWVETSKRDLSSMEINFQFGKYDWALFIGHLALEKILKALWVKNNENNIPPKIHNLNKLAEAGKLKLSDQQEELLFDITSFQIETRYPDYKSNFYKKCTKEFSSLYIKKISELYKCILEMI